MKEVWTGVESSGKSLALSKKAEEVLKRNIRWYKKTGFPSTMAFNTPMSEEFIFRVKEAGLKYIQWENLIDVLGLVEADIFIDEIIKYFPANGSQPLSAEQMDFLTQGAKSGIHIYGASQDFSQVHKQFRLLVNQVHVVTKIIGSSRPMKRAPKVKRIWGLCMSRDVHPMSFKGDSATMDSIGMMPSFFFIQREDCMRYFTGYKVPRTTLPDKIVRKQKVIGYDENGEVIHQKIVWI